MDNQDQYNSESEVDPGTTVTEFSTRRRAFTAVLVLVAALLLGYIAYIMIFSSQTASDQPTIPVEPELSEQEQVMQRLEEYGQRPYEPMSASTSERLEAYGQKPEVPPSQDEIDRLEQYQTGS